MYSDLYMRKEKFINMYYVEDNGKIILFGENYQLLDNTIKVIPQYCDTKIQQTDREIVSFENAFYFKDEISDNLHALEIETRRHEIELELEELDKKRIRALCEPSLKDEDTTWLEFYNEKIFLLRNELLSIK